MSERRGGGVRDGFERMRAIADTVLYEGYLLYPYRASADKNRLRWQFGVLAPRAWSEATDLEPWWMQTECLCEVGPHTRIRARARFLQSEVRGLERRSVDGGFEAVEELVDGERVYTRWEEARVREIDFACLLSGSGGGPLEVPIAFEAASRPEVISGADGAPIGRFVRESAALAGRLVVSWQGSDEPRSHVRLRIRAENLTPWTDRAAPRDEALRGAFTGFHLLLEAEHGAFVSLTDPPGWAGASAEACENVRSWPVLAGDPGDHSLLLSAPIILSDHPQVAPESPGDLYDATEIDEILSLRTMTLTDAEKREARATDPRAAAIIDRCDALGPEILERLHGAVRSLRPARPEMEGLAPPGEATSPEDALWEGWTDPTVPGEGSVEIAGVLIERGARVRLRPRHRADAQDFLLADREARVAGVFEDIEGRTYLGVVLEGADPEEGSLHPGHGRYLYFFPDEVVPMRGEQ